METLYDTLSEKKQKIFNVCVNLFYQKGFAETSVRDIAQDLNIKAASLYAHVDSKEQILEWIITHYIDIVTNTLSEFKKESRTFAEQMNFIIQKNVTITLDSKELSDVFKRYMHLVDLKIRQRYIDFSKEYRVILSNALNHYKAEKQIDFDPDLAANFLIFSLNNVYKWIPENYTKPEIIDIFKNKIIGGFIGKEIEC